MDPTTALSGLREKMHALDPMSPSDRDDVEQFVAEFDALDEWLEMGGFLPEQWAAAGVGRNRGNRPVLDSVRHGTRRGYNEGCGCNACTMANRLRRNLTQAELRQMS